MKTIIPFSVLRKITVILSLVLLFTSCGKDEELGNTLTITSNIESINQGRSTVKTLDLISWTRNGEIGVFGEKRENVRFQMTSMGSENIDFTGFFDPKTDNIRFAYYPYDNTVEYDGASLSFLIPQENRYESGFMFPMLGKGDSNQWIDLYLTGGILEVQVERLPDNTSYIEITSDEGSPLLSGKATVEEIMEELPTYTISSGSHTISYIMPFITEEENSYTLYITLQEGKYDQLSFTLMDFDNLPIRTLYLTNIGVQRGELFYYGTIDFFGL